MGIDAILALGGLIVPPAFDFIKKKFLKRGTDSPESTMSTLATTKPDALAGYVDALARYTEAQVKWFQRDVQAPERLWTVTINIRGLIRPLSVAVGGFHLFLTGMGWGVTCTDELRYFYIVIGSSWFGDKLNKE